MGLLGSTSTYACPCCFVYKDLRPDISKPMEFYDNASMKRTLETLDVN